MHSRIQEKLERYHKIKVKLSEATVKSYTRSFELEYTHNSTAIEGNTLTLLETKVVLEEDLSVGGKYLREIYEVINHNKAYQYVKKCISEGRPLDENITKDIHSILMEHTPPSPNDMYRQVKEFYLDLAERKFEHVTELAAWTHAEFVRIHPYVDGNGRTSRLIMNYQLMFNGYLPISIKKETRLEYFSALESYAVNGDISAFEGMIAGLEEEQLDRYLGMKID